MQIEVEVDKNVTSDCVHKLFHQAPSLQATPSCQVLSPAITMSQSTIHHYQKGPTEYVHSVSLTSHNQSCSNFHAHTPSVSGFPPPPVSSLSAVVAGNITPSERRGKKTTRWHKDRQKGQERLSVIFSIQVTICFRGNLLCDSLFIKQNISTHSSHLLFCTGDMKSNFDLSAL